MRKGWWENVWLMRIVVAVGYALAYLVVRPLSDAHWALTSGLRVASLILMPYRFWPALVAGEIFPLAWWNYMEGMDYGWVWVFVASIPPVAIGMPIVWWCRNRFVLFPSRRLINMSALLQCLLWLSTAWALTSHLLYLVGTPIQPEDPVIPVVGMAMYFLGNYLGMITILPWALLIRLERWDGQWRFKMKQLFGNRMARDIFCVVLPLMGALSVLSHVEQEEIVKLARAIMILPVAWLTLRHGWRASVLGGTFAAACVCMAFECKIDLEMVQDQAYVAVGLACMYALGACISAQKQQKDQVRGHMLRAQKTAKNSLNFGERRLEHASRALESVLGVLEVEQFSISQKLRYLSTDTERRVYDKRASLLQVQIYHLAESIHPSAWRLGGMEAALRDSVGRVLREAGMLYDFRATGLCSEPLSPSIQAAIYRSVCAAVASMSSDLACAAINVTMREGMACGRRWVALRISGDLSELAVARNVCLADERGRVAPKLGAHALDFQELRNLVQLFDGELRICEDKDTVKVTALLFDSSQGARESTMAFTPPRLWVS